MSKANFKVRVVENIGLVSLERFGEVGNVLEVKSGSFEDLRGFLWTNDEKTYRSVEDINRHLNVADHFQTVFELVETGGD